MFLDKTFLEQSKMKTLSKIRTTQQGFSLPEIVVVLLVIAILIVLALPQIISSRRLLRFTGMQRQVASSLVDARQSAMSQRTTITFRYDNGAKRAIFYGGSFGAVGDAKNKVVELSGSGVDPSEIIYGRPSGVTTSALADTSNLTALASNVVDITFQSDGSVIDAGNNPTNNALFFYNNKYARDSAFAISILGAGGRVKVWHYNQAMDVYVE